jgi:hypothetical protein
VCDLRKYILFAFSIFALHCKPPEERTCFKGSGDLLRKRISLPEFSSIEIKDRIRVILIQDSMNYAVVETGSGLIQNIETEVRGNRLFVDDHNDCDFLRSFTYPVNVFIHFRKIDTFWYYGAGSVYCQDTIRVDSLSLNCQEATGMTEFLVRTKKLYVNLHTGVSEYVVSGKSEELYVYSRGTAPVRTENTSANFVWANNYSALPFYIRPLKQLIALIQYKGDIVYFGSPAEIEERNMEYGGRLIFNP